MRHLHGIIERMDMNCNKEERERKNEERELKGVVNLRINLRVFEAFQGDCA